MDDLPDTAGAHDPQGGAVHAEQQALAQLHHQAEDLRQEMSLLQSRMALAQHEFNDTRAQQLMEANEHLVLAALQADGDIEDAARSYAVRHAAQRDPLTGLPNRALMADRLHTALAMARRQRTGCALLFIDLDDFKAVNDVHGHATGDAVLQQVARRIESAVRGSDTVSRHGGDEFLVLVPEVARADAAARVGSKIQDAIAADLRIGQQVFHLRASIGVALFPDDGRSAEALMAHADAAMYRAKRQPRDPPATGRHQHLREANEQLVLAAMAAQETVDQVAVTHRQHVGFIATVAHELRNPLAPIRTAASVLRRLESAGPVVGSMGAVIERQVTHIARLVEDLLDGSRISTGKFTLQRRPLDLKATVQQAVDDCSDRFDARRQTITVRAPDAPVPLQGDPERLAQVFSNLLENASRYSGVGGAISVDVQAAPPWATVTVADNGIGIVADALPHIFDLFVQVSDEPALRRTGLGIGLAVVRELVHSHGGTVAASSPGRGQGSCFVVTLPM